MLASASRISVCWPHRERRAAVERGADVAHASCTSARAARYLPSAFAYCSWKASLLAKRAAAADAAPHLAGELVEHAAAQAGRPARVAHDGEANDTERVEGAAAFGDSVVATWVNASGTNTSSTR
jgi:hypothetical protein